MLGFHSFACFLSLDSIDLLFWHPLAVPLLQYCGGGDSKYDKILLVNKWKYRCFFLCTLGPIRY